MAKRQEIPDILGQLRQPVNVLDDVLSGKPLGTFPKEVDYPIDRIIIGKRLRPVKDVTELAASMAESGLLQRIVLLPDGTLVVGGHRVAAAKLLGWTTIPARIAELDEVDAELAEIDENLYRRELTVLEQAEHLQRRMELLEIKGQRAKPGDNQHSDATTTAAVAESIGISERSAQQRLQIARGLSQAARDALRDTDLAQSTTKLLDLAKQPQEYQVAIIEKMVNEGFLNVDAAASTVIPYKVGPDQELIAQGERNERERLAYMEENGRRNEEHFRQMREQLAAAKAAPAAERAQPTVLNGGRIVPGREYQTVEQLTNEVRTCVRQHYIEPHERARAASDMYASAGARAGGFWKFVTTQTANYTQPDLVNAIYKVADEIAAGIYVWDIVADVEPEDPTISLDELEVVDSVTVRVDDGGKLMMDWDDDDWAAYQRKLEQRQAANVVPSEATHSRQQGAELAKCSVCHRPLSDPASAIAGVGPCCAAKRTTAAGSGDAALDVLAPDRNEVSSAAQKRNERIESVLRRLYAAQAAASEFEELTGVYTHTPAFRRVMENMISVLEANRI